ncbi:hypothetical protein LNKW23_44640 [Paralimibaculum aggregatum]|uniref:Uncharacterized protein n=1 Tax=Paralimibaculum aggregatum TaxID=3036245 RepID=A0ABQ6LT40_9RHOB|nr:hypothetical protein [Limibaculum sp. NKW23]GMG85247.1 hypothetical protein LNKW23_44640 [Limibaculum sp. NKW23]
MRYLAYALILLGLAVAAADLAASLGAGETARLATLGEWWFWADPDSLQLFQPAVERHVSPALWTSVIQPLLLAPLALELLGLGAVFWLLARALRPRRRRRR